MFTAWTASSSDCYHTGIRWHMLGRVIKKKAKVATRISVPGIWPTWPTLLVRPSYQIPGWPARLSGMSWMTKCYLDLIRPTWPWLRMVSCYVVNLTNMYIGQPSHLTYLAMDEDGQMQERRINIWAWGALPVRLVEGKVYSWARGPEHPTIAKMTSSFNRPGHD